MLGKPGVAALCEDMRFIGHPMVAFLGCGAAFPCQRSVGIGNSTPRGSSRIVWAG